MRNQDPFLRHEFLAALEASGAVSRETGWQPLHLLVFEDRTLIAAMPLYLKSHSSGEYVFDHQWAQAYYQCGINYFPKWVNAVPFTPCQGQRVLIKPGQNEKTVIAACLDYIRRISEEQLISSLHSLFPLAEQVDDYPERVLIRTGTQFQWFNKDYRDFADYLQSFTSRQRKNVMKERNKIAQQGIVLERVEGVNISPTEWEVFFDFYQMTYMKRGQHPYLNLAFFTQVAESMPDQVLMTFAKKDRRTVGAALSFIGQDTLYGRYWGCTEEYDSLHFETCYYQGLEYCLEHRKQRFDSGAQGEHKISRGFEPIDTYSAHWFRHPQFAEAIADFLIREKRWIAEYKLDCTQKLPFKSNVAE